MFFTEVNGNNLNFRIKTYPSEMFLLADTPAENTIGLIIDSKSLTANPRIGKRYFFSTTEVESRGYTTLWFQLDTTSPCSLQATRKNPIYVNPIKCFSNHKRNDDGGAWSPVISYLYKDSKWNIFGFRYLYQASNDYNVITGGWGGKSVPFSGTTAVLVSADTTEQGSMELNFTKERLGTDASVGMVLACKNKIDLTHYKTLTFKGLFEYENSNSNAYYCCWTEFGDTYQKNIAASAIYKANNTEKVVIDVSALTGEHYIGVGVRSARVRIDECYLEM